MIPALVLWLVLALPALGQDGALAYAAGRGLTPHLGDLRGPELRAGRLTCAGCHGADGGGGSEGRANAAPPIRWPILTQPTDQRPAYDEAAFARLLAEGITPSGRRISAAMPRFRASDETVALLIAHLRQLDRDETRGVLPDRIALRLPRDPEARAGALAAIAVFNAGGGAYGRQLVEAEPAFLDLDAALARLSPRLTQAEDERLRRFLQEQPEFRTPPARAARPGRYAERLDRIAPLLPALLARPGTEVAVIGPAPAAMKWALGAGASGTAAHAYAATTLVLEVLWTQGRQPLRSRLEKDVATIDPAIAVEIYRQTAPDQSGR